MYLHDEKEAFQEIIDTASQTLNIPPAIVEKDYYVTMFLKQLLAVQPNIVFKGGTSLSKCYHLIERFSEDIDLSIFLNDKPTEGQRRQLKNNVIDAAGTLPLELGNLEEIRSRRDFNRYEFRFDSMFGADYLKQHLIVETAVFFKIYPVEKKMADSFIYTFLMGNGYTEIIDTYHLYPFEILVQSLERTLIDKVYALCDYALAGEQNGHSRHIYDLYKLLTCVQLNEELKQLAMEVRLDRRKNKTCLSAQEGVSVKHTLYEIIDNQTFKPDYETVTSVLMFNRIPYVTAISALQTIADSEVFN